MVFGDNWGCVANNHRQPRCGKKGVAKNEPPTTLSELQCTTLPDLCKVVCVRCCLHVHVPV